MDCSIRVHEGVEFDAMDRRQRQLARIVAQSIRALQRSPHLLDGRRILPARIEHLRTVERLVAIAPLPAPASIARELTHARGLVL
jgi:hypothetical protein